MIWLLIGAILELLGVAVAHQAVNEFRAWNPRLVNILIARAVRHVPESHRARLEEEWTAHINDIPGDIGKLIVALGFLRVPSALSESRPFVIRAGLTSMIAVAEWTGAVLAGMTLVTGASFWMLSRGPVSLDWLTPYVQQSISEQKGLIVRVEHTQIVLAAGPRLEIVTEGLHVHSVVDGSELYVRSMSMGLAPLGFFHGKLVPTFIQIGNKKVSFNDPNDPDLNEAVVLRRIQVFGLQSIPKAKTSPALSR